ncbi:hypothetical protein ZIOFF_035133 [Zingiber officinale]|uniref:Phosphofructokinase domain-containing protein n=1 Tax=Zingiber officinale TaxID=94328 RepID=A0A8J5GE99_ZINOF|nr:hypothetical protein ZIOFF_035133 [Zingiber officinale]
MPTGNVGVLFRFTLSRMMCLHALTCGGLCPGLNTVIQEIVCDLSYMYDSHNVLGIEEIWRRHLKFAVGIPKTIDNDIAVIDKSFGFDNAAHVEAESVENGICIVKSMGKGGLFEYVEKALKENGHMVIVVAEGAGQDLIAESMKSMEHEDASGNKLLLDVGLWLSQRIKVHFKFNSKPISIYQYAQSRVVFFPFYIHHALNTHLSEVQF